LFLFKDSCILEARFLIELLLRSSIRKYFKDYCKLEYMPKCYLCKSSIEETFLNKIIGTYLDKKAVCSVCQKQYNKEELLEKIK
jgi:hypothetical protein